MKVLSHGSEPHGPLDLITFLLSKRHLVRSQLHNYGTSFNNLTSDFLIHVSALSHRPAFGGLVGLQVAASYR